MSNVWQLTVQIQQEDHTVYDEILSAFEAGIDLSKKEGIWQLSAFVEEHVPQENIEQALKTVHSILGRENSYTLKQIPQSDWKEKLKQDFPPMEIGSFFIHSFDEEIPEGMTGLKIPAGLAFGTGEHPTTAGCLTLLEDQLEERTFKNVLDMGCGSAILAMAASKKLNVPCLAVDIDEESVETANDNLIINNATKNVTCVHGDGFATNIVQTNMPYDLIFANILANPLIEMADDMVKVMAENGVLILSGFTEDQMNNVVEAYTSNGLNLVGEIKMENWVAISLKRL